MKKLKFDFDKDNNIHYQKRVDTAEEERSIEHVMNDIEDKTMLKVIIFDNFYYDANRYKKTTMQRMVYKLQTIIRSTS